MARPQALGGILAISFSAILVKAAAVSPSTSAFFRAAYAVPVLAAVWWWHRRRDRRPWRSRRAALVAGVFLGVDLTLWHQAIDLVGAGLATVIANLQVLFVALAAWAVHQERPTAAAALAVPVALGGVALTTGLGRADAYGADPVLGALLSLGAALAYTGFLLLFRAGGRERGPTVGPVLDATLGTAVTAGVLGLVLDPGFTLIPSWPAHGYLVLLALGAHSIGWVLIGYALPRLAALETSVLLLLQPVLTVLWSVLIFAEAPSSLQWLGIALVLAGVGIASVKGAARAGPTPMPEP